jgi:hypothetical protein
MVHSPQEKQATAVRIVASDFQLAVNLKGRPLDFSGFAEQPVSSAKSGGCCSHLRFFHLPVFVISRRKESESDTTRLCKRNPKQRLSSPALKIFEVSARHFLVIPTTTVEAETIPELSTVAPCHFLFLAHICVLSETVELFSPCLFKPQSRLDLNIVLTIIGEVATWSICLREQIDQIPLSDVLHGIFRCPFN